MIDIQSNAELADFCSEMDGQPYITIDTEFIRERTFYPILALVQVSWKDRVPVLIGGAAVAVPLWLLAEWGFSLYVLSLVGKGSIYGTLGLIPLFLIW